MTDKGPHRRACLAGSVAALVGGALARVAPAARGGELAAPDETVRLAAFLTGKADLPPALVERARLALEAEDASLAQALATLAVRIAAAKLSDAGAFHASPLGQDATLSATAIAFVRALYTGHAGKGWQGHLVSYEDALMFRPTADATLIPSYSRGGPGYWAEPPSADAP